MMKLYDYIYAAIEESKKSIDPTRGVGALLLKNTDDRVVSRGYNTFPFWVDSNRINTMTKDEKAIVATHAEIECLENTHNCLDHNNDMKYTMIITCAPCINCSIAIVNSRFNITNVVYPKLEYSDSFTKRFRIHDSTKYLNENGIEVNEICHTL